MKWSRTGRGRGSLPVPVTSAILGHVSLALCYVLSGVMTPNLMIVCAVVAVPLGGLDALLNRGVRRQAIAAAACASISALAYILWMIHIGWGEVLVRYGFVVTFAFMVPLFALAQFVIAFVCDRVVRMHAGRPERDPGRSLR